MPEHISEHLIYSATLGAPAASRSTTWPRISVRLKGTPSTGRAATSASGAGARWPRRHAWQQVSRCRAVSWRFVTLGDAPFRDASRLGSGARCARWGLPHLSPIAAIDLVMRLIGLQNRLGSGEDMSMPSDLPDLWRQRQEVGAALDSGLLAADDPAGSASRISTRRSGRHGPLIRPAWRFRCGCSPTSSRPAVMLPTKAGSADRHGTREAGLGRRAW